MSMKQILLSRTAPSIVHSAAYANSLTPIMGDIYAALDVVSREMIGFTNSVTRNATAERAAVGQQITYPIAPKQTMTDIVPAMVAPSGYDNAFGVGSMALTKSKAVKWNFTGEEERALNASPGPQFLSAQAMIIAQAFREIANAVETDLAAEAAASASRAYGTPGTTPFDPTGAAPLRDVALLRKILDDNGAPASGRSMITNTTAGANLRSIPNLTRVNEAGSQMTLRDGQLLDLHGFSVKESGQSVAHTKGTASGATTDASGYAVGDTVIALASAGTGSIVAGDVITFAGDANKYVVESGDASSADGGTITLAQPGLREPIVGATAISVGDSYEAAGVAFSMDAMHLAMRPPARPSTGDQAVAVQLVTDVRSGITFEIAVYPGYRMMYGEIGLAWGTHASKSEHIALLLG